MSSLITFMDRLSFLQLLLRLVLILVLTACSRAVLISADTELFNFVPQNNARDSFSLQSLISDGEIRNNPFPTVDADGEILLMPDPTDSTQDRARYKVGRVIYKKPIPIRDDQLQVLSFHTSFTFKITTITKYNESGDGLAFVITTDGAIPANSTGRFLGLLPEFHKDRHQRFFAVEFDTFQNNQAEILDPSASHIGIDISNLSSVAYLDTSQESHPLYLYKNYTITAWISYNASSHLIQVWATNISNSPRPPKPILTFRHNLSQVFENLTDIYAGITTASGNNSQATILYSWNFGRSDNGSDHLRIWLLAVVVLVCLLAASAAIYIRLRWRRSVKHREDRAAIESVISGGVRRYKYTELMQATQKFSDERRIGAGGFSSVYRGVLRDGTEVAVKRMKGLGTPMDAELIAREVQIISRIRHRHLLQLQGWCYERGEALLIYDYMARGSLDSYLYGERRRSGQVIDGDTRFKILVGVAAALEYLHGDLPGSIRVVHRDVKAANVLLSDTMGAMLADFGLSRLIADDKLVTLTAAGTPGYVAPEVMQTGRVNDKVDVYSFGVLALEVSCGRQALDLSNPRYSRLADCVWLQHQKTCILDALDPQIADTAGSFSSQSTLASSSSTSSRTSGGSVEQRATVVLGHSDGGVDQRNTLQKWQCVLHLGLLCCQAEPDSRPSMREVQNALKECRVLPPPYSWTLYPAAGVQPAAGYSGRIQRLTPSTFLDTVSGRRALSEEAAGYQVKKLRPATPFSM